MQHGSPPQKSLAGTSTGSGLGQMYRIVNSTTLCAVPAPPGRLAQGLDAPASPVGRGGGTGCRPSQCPTSARPARMGRGGQRPQAGERASGLAGSNGRSTGSFGRTGWPGQYFRLVMIHGQICFVPAAPPPPGGPGAGNPPRMTSHPARFQAGTQPEGHFCPKMENGGHGSAAFGPTWHGPRQQHL
ncbi:hypothetical protein DVDV_3499 [Desulfovibrio sp. DV]|nr:hypothetical protein DVDV_3499 [Desulfovibrio sp. DV]